MTPNENQVKTDLHLILSVLSDMIVEIDVEGRARCVHSPNGDTVEEVLPAKGIHPHERGKNPESWSRRALDGQLRRFEGRYFHTQYNTVVVLIRDVTEVRVRAEELRKSNEQLQQFANMASHDLQEPLRGMHGPALILLEELGPSLSPEHRRWLEHIHHNASRAQTMVRDMLQFSRAGSKPINQEIFDAREAVLEIVESFRSTIDDNKADVVIGDVPPVRYDRMKLQVVIANLLSNALKFHKPGKSPRVEIWGQVEKTGQVRIIVKDDGIGIPPEDRNKILEPGFRGHHRDTYSGSGLGLASVALIVDRCGGTLSLKSTVDEGSEFALVIPGAEGVTLPDESGHAPLVAPAFSQGEDHVH